MNTEQPTKIPKTLENRLRDNKVIPFVGAGVSMSVLDKEGNKIFPSWKELLLIAADRLDAEQKPTDATLVRALLDIEKPEYLNAAKRARDGLKTVWYPFLKEQLDYSLEKIDDSTLELAQSIWRLGNNLIITSNYDRVLRWACPKSDDLIQWDIEAPAELASAMRDGVSRPTVWHLHGHIDNASKLILTPDGYNRLYPDEGETEACYKAAIQTLKSFMTSHTFLFVGLSLDDSHFGMQLKGIDDIFDGAAGPHYVLVHEDNRKHVQSLNLPVEIITFSNYGAPLIELINYMGTVASQTKTASKTSKTPPAEIVSSSVSVSYDPHNSVFYVPFRQKGDMVIGREDALKAVRDQLTKGKPTAIGQTASFQGLGGLGKTQLAVEYAYYYKEEYPNGVIWITADQDIDAQLIELAETAHWIAPESEHKYKLDIAKQRLRSYSDCLIIFDNLEDVANITDYLPEPTATPHVLVTSRIEQTGFNPIPLDLLNEELSYLMLVQEAGRKPEGDAEIEASKDIVAKLGGLPLALELAGAYLRYRPTISWVQYQELLNQSLKEALPGKFLKGGFTKHETDIYKTLKINEKLLIDDPMLIDILDLLTWSGSSPMGLSLMCALLDINNAVELTNALSLGTVLRLLIKTPNEERYSVHRLVHEVRREDIPLEERVKWVNNVCNRIGDWFQARKDNFNDLSEYENEIDHLRMWQEHAVDFSLEHASRLAWLQGYPPDHRGNYQEAKDWVEKALILYKDNQNDPELKAHLFADLGSTSGALGDYKSQLEYSKKAFNIQLKEFGEHHPDTASSFNNIGYAYGNLGNYDKQREYFEKALKIRREISGEQHPDTATSFNNVGAAYEKLGDYDKQLEYYEKALKIRLKEFGEYHPYTATILNNKGYAYGTLGNYKKQLEYFEKALKIRFKQFGEQHPDTATSFNNVGGAYGNLGNYDKQLEYFEKALKIRLEIFGEQHPDTAASFHNVGGAYTNLGNNKKQFEYFEKALKIYTVLLGAQHPHTLASVCHIVNELIAHKRYAIAYKLANKFLTNLPKDNLYYSRLFSLKQRIPGFQKVSSKSQSKKKKKKKRK